MLPSIGMPTTMCDTKQGGDAIIKTYSEAESHKRSI